jgi:hypothetical protein
VFFFGIRRRFVFQKLPPARCCSAAHLVSSQCSEQELSADPRNSYSFDIEVVGGANSTTASYYSIHFYGDEYDILPPDLDWHHLAASYDGTTAKWYGDGSFIGSLAGVLNTMDNVQMGKRADDNNRFSGLIDEVRIYGRALSLDEVAYLAGKTHAIHPAYRAILNATESQHQRL